MVRDIANYHTTMAPHRCNYCLKPMATEAGIKRHIAQSSACRDQWSKVLECLKFTVSDDEDDQPPAQMDDDAPDYPYDWEDAFDGMDGPDVGLDVPDGHLVHQTRVDVDPGPPDLVGHPLNASQSSMPASLLRSWIRGRRSSSLWKRQDLKRAKANGHLSVMKMNGI